MSSVRCLLPQLLVLLASYCFECYVMPAGLRVFQIYLVVVHNFFLLPCFQLVRVLNGYINSILSTYLIFCCSRFSIPGLSALDFGSIFLHLFDLFNFDLLLQLFDCLRLCHRNAAGWVPGLWGRLLSQFEELIKCLSIPYWFHAREL